MTPMLADFISAYCRSHHDRIDDAVRCVVVWVEVLIWTVIDFQPHRNI